MGELQAKVDIVIPCYNRADLITHLVDTLQGEARIDSIILMDDCSEKSQSEYIKNLENTQRNVRYFRSAGNMGFVQSVNRGVDKSTNPYVLILNSDTEALPHAVENMARALDNGFAVCGALLVFGKGSGYGQEGFVQHCSIGFNPDGVPYHPFMNLHPKHPAVQTFRSVNAVTGAALMTKREVWDKIGGFDRKFSPGAYEDVSYCLSAKALGLEVAYEPEAIFTHLQHASQTSQNNFFSQPNLNKNLQILWQKHGQGVGTTLCDDYIFYNVGRSPLKK